MHFSAWQDVRLKKSVLKLSPSTIFNHGLLEGSTFLSQYSSTSHSPLESSQLGELKYAISAGYDVRLKNKSLRKGEIHIVQQAYLVTDLWTGLDRFEQVRTGTIFLNRESHALQILPTPETCVQFSNRTSLETLRPIEVVETALCHAPIGVRWELVWSATFLPRASTGPKSLESSQ